MSTKATRRYNVLAVPLVLDMWAFGCTAPVIANALQIKGGYRAVQDIVEQARSIKDPRAVLHSNGNPRKRERLLDQRPDLKVIAAKRGPQRLRSHCSRGHEYTMANTRKLATGQRQCRECAKLVRRKEWKEIRYPVFPRAQLQAEGEHTAAANANIDRLNTEIERVTRRQQGDLMGKD